MSSAKRKIDLNTARPDTLAELNGIGHDTAEAIVRHRDRSGGFRSIDELNEIAGIGPATVKSLSKQVRVERHGSDGGEAGERKFTAATRRPVQRDETDDTDGFPRVHELRNRVREIITPSGQSTMPPLVHMSGAPAEYARLNVTHWQQRASRYVELSRRLSASRAPDDIVQAYGTFWNETMQDYSTYWQAVAKAVTKPMNPPGAP